MKMRYVFLIAMIASLLAFVLLSYAEEYYLSYILSGIIMTWPIVFWLINKVAENYITEGIPKISKEKSPEDSSEETNLEEPSEKFAGKIPEEIIEEVKETSQMNEDLEKVKEDLNNLREAGALLENEFEQGLITKESYDELKSDNEKKIIKLKEKLNRD